jgi:imidazolonepropionase-like amidohydrolase
MGSWPLDLRRSLRQQAIDQNLTEVWTAGIIATVPGSSHSRIPALPQEALLTGPEQASQFVTDRIAEGSDYIKMIVDIPGPSQGLLNALVSAAHEHGKLTVAHATSSAAYAMAQGAKVDIVTHAPLDVALDGPAIQKMVAEKRVVIPTLLMMQGLAKVGKRHGHNHSYSNANDTVSALHAANVSIFAGTDGNGGTESPVPHGESIHSELELLVAAGLSTVEALQAATVEPAKYFGMNDRGVIEPGRRADLLLIANDPIQDIRATRSIRRVWCRGVEFQPSLK